MTKAEIEKEAREYVGRKRYRFEGNEYEGDIADGLHDAYIAGAKENGIVWHDLRKNPDDLPARLQKEFDVSIFVFNQNLEQCYYDYRQKHWFTENSDEMIAWCEIPKFEEK